DHALQLAELALLDALHPHDVFGRLERAVRLTVVDDSLCLDWTDARQRVQFLLGGRVDIDGRGREAREQQQREREQQAFHWCISPGHVRNAAPAPAPLVGRPDAGYNAAHACWVDPARPATCAQLAISSPWRQRPA